MAKVTREGIISIYDLLVGCRTLVQNEVPVGEGLEPYISFTEHVIDRYFFNLEEGERTLADKIGDAFELSAETATEISTFLEGEIVPRIQRTFNCIYPNRHYTYTVNAEQSTVRVVESKWDGLRLMTITEESDESDAWVPERLRRRT